MLGTPECAAPEPTSDVRAMRAEWQKLLLGVSTRSVDQETASRRSSLAPRRPRLALGARNFVHRNIVCAVLHEAYGTGTALGGAMGDASTAGDSATGGAKAAASRATEDMHTLIRALKTDLSCMSVRLERLEALLSA